MVNCNDLIQQAKDIDKEADNILDEIDNKKVDTIFINDKTLKIKMIKTGDTLQVKQLGRNDGLLSKSNSIDLLFSDLAKK